MAWSAPSCWQSDGEVLWGLAFELLPGSSMQNAACCLHGIIGWPAEQDPRGAEPRLRTIPGAPLSIFACMDTAPEHLAPYKEDLVSAFHERMTELGLSVGA